MGTIADKLNAISTSKESIRGSIINKGVPCPADTLLSAYDEKIGLISGEGGNTPYVRLTSARDATGTSLTASIDCQVGELILAVVTVRSTLTVPTGWTLLYTSPGIGSSQVLHVLYKTASSTSETITIVQSNSDRIYINLMVIRNAGIPHMIDEKYQSGTSPYANPITINKDLSGLVIWHAHMRYWNAAGACDWTSSPNLRIIQIGPSSASIQPRLGSFIDDASPVNYIVTITAAISYPYELCAVSIPAAA